VDPRTCPWCGKICHTTRGLALRAGRHAARPGTRLRAYRCPAGQGWHLTSARPPRRRRAARERARRAAQIRIAFAAPAGSRRDRRP
jgi:hypothetical protein